MDVENTTICTNCGKEADTNAEICPFCGAAISKSETESIQLQSVDQQQINYLQSDVNAKKKHKKLFIIILAALVILIVLGIIIFSNQNKSEKNSDNETNILSEEEYKSECQIYSYETIARSPDEYKNTKAKIYGKVIQVMPEKKNGKINYTLRIATDENGYYDDIYLAVYTASDSEPRILEDDMITVYGELKGEYTYEALMGNQITIPLVAIEYIEYEELSDSESVNQ